ncbi:hypothetical protein Cgig2_032423 [Carnegiea gigantea]|uniref:Uncharacterized protein n=1 Tax=Carnegiea gigantea TaxID=171969 RepID=A0A9Q1KXP4_9CARY|nr:hypothetical protein Cgig2_032423 [Carnegiea gigantea]
MSSCDDPFFVAKQENGTLPLYELAPEGVKQAKLAGDKFKKELEDASIPLEKVRICYSPFTRTAHTARVVASVLGLPFEGDQCKVIKILKQVVDDLRERYFGPSFELESHDRYAEIWALDEKNPFECPKGGESAADVVSRLARAIEQMEDNFEGYKLLNEDVTYNVVSYQKTVFHAGKEQEAFNRNGFASRIEAVKVPSILSKHRKFGLETGELRAVA